MRRGVALIAVLFITLLLEGVIVGVAMLTVSELDYVQAEADYAKAYNNAVSGMTIAQILVNTSNYDGNNNNVRLLTAYTNNTPLVREPGKFEVWVEKPSGYPELWYQLHAYGYGGDVTSEIVLRVRMRDYFSRWNIYADNGWVVVDDPNKWYGRVHVNSYLGFRNRVSGSMTISQSHYRLNGSRTKFILYGSRSYNFVGAQFFETVTAAHSTQNSFKDYHESGGARQAIFYKKPETNVGEIDFPGVGDLHDKAQWVRQGATSYTLKRGAATVGRLYIGPRGISVDRQTSKRILMYIQFAGYDASGNARIKFRLLYDGDNDFKSGSTYYAGDSGDTQIWPTSGKWDTRTFSNAFVVHNEDDIPYLQGNVGGRITVISEKGEVFITDDIVYVDQDGDPAVSLTSNGLEENDNYDGNSSLGVIAKKNVYLTNASNANAYGSATGDDDLLICGAFASGVGGSDSDGSVSWLPDGTYVYVWDANGRKHKVDALGTRFDKLAIYGALLADGNSATGLAHWKGYTTGSGGAGYGQSFMKYDQRLMTNPPPHYLEVNMPLYVGWQLVR